MKEQNISKVYAKAFIDLAKESNTSIVEEFTILTELINDSNDFENLLFLDVFSDEEKKAVLDDVFGKMNASKLLKDSVSFLIQEKRLPLMPLIYKDMVVYEDNAKGFLKGTIEGSLDNIDESAKTQLTALIKTKMGKDSNLEYKKNNDISAGFKVTVDDYQIDATFENQIDKLKDQILGF
jgi:F-type H+-transporting ATPase subunit delta